MLLKKGVYTYEYMGDWEKFIEKLLIEKGFYRRLNVEDITDVDHTHEKIICKDFEIKTLYVQKDTLLLARCI